MNVKNCEGNMRWMLSGNCPCCLQRMISAAAAAILILIKFNKKHLNAAQQSLAYYVRYVWFLCKDWKLPIPHSADCLMDFACSITAGSACWLSIKNGHLFFENAESAFSS